MLGFLLCLYIIMYWCAGYNFLYIYLLPIFLALNNFCSFFPSKLLNIFNLQLVLETTATSCQIQIWYTHIYFERLSLRLSICLKSTAKRPNWQKNSVTTRPSHATAPGMWSTPKRTIAGKANSQGYDGRHDWAFVFYLFTRPYVESSLCTYIHC